MDYKLIVGIDVSKLTIDAALMETNEPDKTGMNCKQFPNNKKGFAAMMKWVQSLYDVETDQLFFCAENTGLYSFPLCVFCREKKICLWLESPLQIKQSMGIQRGKNDRVDAMRIAQYAYTHRHVIKPYQLPGKILLALQQLLSYRERLVRAKKSIQTPARELNELRGDITGLISKESKSLAGILEKKIDAVNEQMLLLIKEDEQLSKQFELITSVPGIGETTAIYFITYTHGFSRFDTWRQFACYCGIAPFEYTSGTSIRGKTRVSHLANKKVKSILTMCAITMIRGSNEYLNYYNRKIKEGKSKMSTINVIRNKIVSRVFAVIKRGTPYLPVEEFQQAA